MNLSFQISRQFLDELYREDLFLSQGFKTINESRSIPRHKLSLGTLIQIMITNDISNTFRTKVSSHESIQ